MKVIINETNEIRDLIATMSDNVKIDWARELTAVDDEIKYDYDEEAYRMSQETYDFWVEYINNMESDTETLNELCEIYDSAEVDEIIDDEMWGDNDYSMHHARYQAAFKRIREELTPINTEMVKFISYSGSYPCLCSGKLKIVVDNKVYEFKNILRSGGSFSYTRECGEMVTHGRWSIFEAKLPKELKSLVEEITECVNSNVSKGCCGGCL